MTAAEIFPGERAVGAYFGRRMGGSEDAMPGESVSSCDDFRFLSGVDDVALFEDSFLAGSDTESAAQAAGADRILLMTDLLLLAAQSGAATDGILYVGCENGY